MKVKLVKRLPKDVRQVTDSLTGEVKYFNDKYYYEPFVSPFGESVYCRYNRPS